MARSYRFDHFQVPKRDTTLVHEDQKQRVTQSRDGGPVKKFHYGKRFQQTEELAQAHVMAHELEELAGMEEEAPRPREEAEAPRARRPKAAPPPPGGVPIGALPHEEALRAESFEELLDLGRRHAKAVLSAARDLGVAGARLFTLPRQAVTLLARRLQPRVG